MNLGNRSWKRLDAKTATRQSGVSVMPAEQSELQPGKGRKRSSAKPPKGPGGGKVKATIHLSVEASQRLTVHAAMMTMDRSELVEHLINQHLRRFVVSDRGGPDSAESAA